MPKYAFYYPLIILFFYVSDLCSFFPADMTNLKLSEQKKLMVEVRVRHGEYSTSKSDMLGIHTCTLKRKKMDTIKASHVV